jgi:hypothetical protein
MAEIYIPYSGKKPAALEINGHKVIILSTNKEIFESDLEIIGADNVRPLKSADTPYGQEKALTALAKKTNAGVVLSPLGMELDELIKNLEHELPWVQ